MANQIVDFVQRRSARFNSEPYCVFEFIVQGGRLDGVRIKEYVKADKEDRGEHEEIK